MNTPPPLPNPTRVPLGEALRLYWKHLVGVAISPFVMFTIHKFFYVPIEFLMPISFLALYACAQLYRRKRVSYSFCFVASSMWVVGVPLASLLIY